MDLRDFLTIMFKHKGKIIVIFLVVATLVAGVTLLASPVYEAKSTLLVKPWKEEARLGIGTSNNNLSLSLSQEEMVNTEIQILTGRELAEKVITAMKPETIYPDLVKSRDKKITPLEASIQAFGKDLIVGGVRKSNVIVVTYQHKDPKVAARAVNLLVEAFEEKHLALHSDPQSSFIGTQLASFDKKLKDSERDLQAFQQVNKVFSLEEQRSLLLKQRMDLDTSYKVARNNVSELTNKISSINGQLKYISKNNARYTPNEREKIITDARSKQLELQLKVQDLRRKYNDNNRLVLDAKKEVELVNQFLKEQEEGISGKVKMSNPVYQNMEMDLFRAEGELNSQKARAEAVKVQLDQLDKEIALLDMSENKLQNMKREIAINEKNYKTYADRQEEARISEAMNRQKLSNISVIQTAVVPAKPVKQNRKIKLLVGTLLGLFAGFAFAYVSETTAETFLSPESAEKYLELPVLLTVPSKEV
jgi:uncharacterized protein involved in exopolysaccharide biosynthesis